PGSGPGSSPGRFVFDIAECVTKALGSGSGYGVLYDPVNNTAGTAWRTECCPNLLLPRDLIVTFTRVSGDCTFLDLGDVPLRLVCNNPGTPSQFCAWEPNGPLMNGQLSIRFACIPQPSGSSPSDPRWELGIVLQQ